MDAIKHTILNLHVSFFKLDIKNIVLFELVTLAFVAKNNIATYYTKRKY